MVDFTSLLKKPAGEAKRPAALDAGTYPAVITGYELGDNNKNKTPYVRFNVKLTGWPDGAEPQKNDDGEVIDISAKQMRRDYYLTADALFRLDEFLTAIGVGMTGKTYEEVLPETVGAQVLAEVQQYMNQSNNDIGNNINALAAAV